MNEDISREEKNECFRKGAVVGLFVVCMLVVFRLVVLKQYSYDLFAVGFISNFVNEFNQYKKNRKKMTLFFAIASLLCSLCCVTYFVMSAIDGTL